MTFDLEVLADLIDDVHVVGGDIPFPGPWSRFARCRTLPTKDVFFPGRGESTDDAKQVCRVCPVLDECKAYALAYPALQGVWGGLSGRERREVRSARPVEKPAAAAGLKPVRSTAGVLEAALLELTQHADRWARVARYASEHSAHSMASQLRTGRRYTPPGRWVFEGRVNQLGGSDLYAKYAGPPSDDTSAHHFPREEAPIGVA